MLVFYVQSEERPANSCSLWAAGQGAEVSRQLLHIFAKLFKVKVKVKVTKVTKVSLLTSSCKFPFVVEPAEAVRSLTDPNDQCPEQM